MKKDNNIRNLLGVLGAAVFGACLLSYLLVVNFGPSGRYKVANILLEPIIAEKVDFYDGKSRYIFQRFEFLYFDQTTNKWDREQLSEDQYKKIYAIIKSELSVLSVTDEVRGMFSQTNPAILSIVVRNESKENTKSLQEMQIADHGDYYRILLRDDSPTPNWVYFYHPQILEQMKHAIKNE